ncbi:glycosyltransferase family 2 protein [Aeromonas bivalvium]|uniref:glycosyltransferase family 2 protein n=1 Tax=Aeromonas bivalvium TaxID=440079 RepID=UPI003D21095A
MIIIPMAGLSSRFFKAGYTKPKYMLDLHGTLLFDCCLNSFKDYFTSEKFLFIVRDAFDTINFVSERAKSLGILDFEVICLEHETRGQAETVYLGLKHIANERQPITIFNIDTIRPDFKFPQFELCDEAYLEVFLGSGDNWSFVKPMNTLTDRVAFTTEKKPVSDLCCTGLYHFPSIIDYKAAYHHYDNLPSELWDAGELYVAPLYNYLINRGGVVRYHTVARDDVIFCGTPDEYLALLSK